MKWIVLEENPTADQYVAVVVADQAKKLKIELKPHSVHASGEAALVRARALRDAFGVPAIKIFSV
jgi:hypothetical protein